MPSQLNDALGNLIHAMTEASRNAGCERPFDNARHNAMAILFILMADQRHLTPERVSATLGSKHALLDALEKWEVAQSLLGNLQFHHSSAVDQAIAAVIQMSHREIWPVETLGGLLDKVDSFAAANGEDGAQARLNRRQTGAYYSQRLLVSTVVGETLKPLLEGAASPDEILSLRVVDPAVGAASFLLDAMEQLTTAVTSKVIKDKDLVRRHVAGTCIFGVDIDSMAVDAARCSVWLESGGCDVSALKEHIICGDSLMGASPLGLTEFDAVVSNPPWNKIKADLKEFYSHFDPAVLGMQGAALKHYVCHQFEHKPALKRTWEQHQEEVRLYARELIASGRYKHQSVIINGRTSGGDPDMYKFFLERALQLTRSGGRLGLLLPSALLTAEGAVQLRHMLVTETRIDALVSIENRDRLFPIDSRFKYCLLVAQRGCGPSEAIPGRYMIRSVAAAREALNRGHLISVPTQMLKDMSPDHFTFVDIQNAHEVRILERIHSRLPLLGTTLPNTWNVRFVRELDMTNDSHLFVDRGEIKSAADIEKRYVPLYEGRMIHQFDGACKGYVSGHGRKAVWAELPWGHKRITPHYYIPRGIAQTVPGFDEPRVGYCDITGQTNERTVLSALIPANAVAGNKVPTLRFDGIDPGDSLALNFLWLGIANSFVVDWLMRLRVSTTVNFFHWYQIPFPRLGPNDPEASPVIFAAALLSGGQDSGLLSHHEVGAAMAGVRQIPHTARTGVDEVSWGRQFIRAQLDAYVAQLYGLSVTDYARILSTFPLLDRRQPSLAGDTDQDGSPRSFITRDLALLTYFDRLGLKPPTDIVRFFAEAGVDVETQTGPTRDLRERVHSALAQGSIAYVPTGVSQTIGSNSEAAD